MDPTKGETTGADREARKVESRKQSVNGRVQRQQTRARGAGLQGIKGTLGRIPREVSK